MTRQTHVRIAAVLFVAACCFILAACGSKISKSNYDRIKEGMTEADVEGLLGKGEEQSSASFNVPGTSVGIPGVGSVSFKGVSASTKVVKWQEADLAITITFTDGMVTGRQYTQK